MKNIINYTFGIIAIFTLIGCGDIDKIEYGPVLTEEGEIYETAYVPAGHGSDIAVGYNTGDQGGLSITPISVDIPERYAVVFKCQHGKFVIDGNKGEALYKRFEKGDRCTITYREIIRIGMKDYEEVSRTVYDLDFIDAKLHQEAEKQQ